MYSDKEQNELKDVTEQIEETIENPTEKGEQKTDSDTGKKKRGFFGGLVCGMLISLLIISTVYLSRNLYFLYQIHQTKQTAEANREEVAATEETTESIIDTDTLSKMQTIASMIEKYYYKDDISMEDMKTGIYKGMLNSLGDPYAEYYSKEELQEILNGTEGISYGIGAYISMDEKYERAVISGIIADTPAERAGLREGDIIYKVDGETTQDLTTSQVVQMVKGAENTDVHLTIFREGETDYLEMDLTREKKIETITVNAGMLAEEGAEDIGYLQITEFDDVTLDQYTEAMASLREEGMKGLILDLRSNPGGNLDTAVDIARKILPEGLIVYTEDKEGQRTEYACDGTHQLDIPLVVLVNQYSASASEVLTGAIQDYKKGTVVGVTTYGKGIVQRIHKISDGTAMKLTISTYYTPLGRNIHGVGLTPDIEVELDKDAYYEQGEDNQLEQAITTIKEQMQE